MITIQELAALADNYSDIIIPILITTAAASSAFLLQSHFKKNDAAAVAAILAAMEYPASFDELSDVERDSFDVLYRIIHMPSSDEVCQPETYVELARYLAEKGIPRRKVPDFIADMINNEEFQFVDKKGNVITFDDEYVDRIFGEGDASYRWIGDFMARRNGAWKQVPQERVKRRIIIIAAAIRADMAEE
jgi:hypothetical protein